MAFDWAGKISGVEGLEPTRDLWFHPVNKDLFLRRLPLREGMKLLDIGCGPGSFTRQAYAWFDGRLDVTGVDLDAFFIGHCKTRAAERGLSINYEVMDALSLSFPDNAFDMTASYSVADHVQTRPFFAGQFRVLKPCGAIAVMYVDGFNAARGEMAAHIPEIEEITKLMETLYQNMILGGSDDQYPQYRMHRKSEAEYLRLMAECGFTALRCDSIRLHHAPDNAGDRETAHLAIDAWFSNDLDLALSFLRKPVYEKYHGTAARVVDLIGHCKQRRKELLDKNVKLWDAISTDTMLLTGRKP